MPMPPLSSGPFAVITRQLIKEWYAVEQHDVTRDDAKRADEVFITSSMRDVQAVERWDDQNVLAARDPSPAEHLPRSLPIGPNRTWIRELRKHSGSSNALVEHYPRIQGVEIAIGKRPRSTQGL
jgi:hypothetical protein